MTLLAVILAILAALALGAAFYCWRELGRSHEREVLLYESLEAVTDAVHGTPDRAMVERVRAVLEQAWRDVHRLG